MDNKVIVIGNEAFSGFNKFVPEYHCDHYSLSKDISLDIEHIKNANPKFIIILLEIPCAKSTTQYGGLEFIIWLRINAIKLPIVAISFQSLQTILKATKYANIFASEGTFFCYYPKDFDKEDVLSQVHKQSNLNNLKSALENCFDIAHFRHSYANIWGLKRLISTYNSIFTENKFSSIDVVDESILGLDYHIAKFYFSKKVETNKHFVQHITKKANEIKSTLNNLRIVFIDDKANTGWLSFLKHLFNNSVEIINIDVKSFTEQEVFNSFRKILNENFRFDYQFKINSLKTPRDIQIEAIVNNKDNYQRLWTFVATEYFNTKIYEFNKEKKIDIIISDLRLFPSDEQVENYQDLVSMGLMKKILKNSMFYKIKYILFTASNQILNFKFLFSHNQFAPSDIFIKEGFDIQYSADQKYINLDHLLGSLLRAGKQSTRSKTTILGKSDFDSENKIIEFDKYSKGNEVENDYKIHYDFLYQFSHIILDTNLYLENKPLLSLKCNNQIMTYPVAKELIRNLNKDGGEEIKAHLSSYFLNQLDKRIKLDLDSLSEQEMEAIDTEFKNKKAYQIADRFFLKALQHYTDIKQSRVLFVTNDIKSDSTTSENSTIFEIIEWAKNYGIQNLTISSFWNSKFDIKYPATFN
jgi:hypothetical protein